MGCGASSRSSRYRYREAATVTKLPSFTSSARITKSTSILRVEDFECEDYEDDYYDPALTYKPNLQHGLRDEADEFRVMRMSGLSGNVSLFVAGGKHKKPVQYDDKRLCPRAAEQPSHWEKCPFCVGNESKTPMNVLAFDDNGTALPVGHVGPWSVRVFPNTFPMLICPPCLYGKAHHESLESLPHSVVARGVHANTKVRRDRESGDPNVNQVDAIGASEVVVESPIHNALLALQSPRHIELLLSALILRGKALGQHTWAKQLLFFKQYGPLSGGSLVHPHTQIVSLPLVPPPLLARLEYSLFAYEEYGECPVCRTLVDPFIEERRPCSPTTPSTCSPRSPGSQSCCAPSRLVHLTDHFVVSVPYAASSQYSMTVAPRKHSANFLDLDAEEKRDLAQVLSLLAQVLYYGLDDPSYNIYIRTAPCVSPVKVRGRDVSAKELSQCFHWILEIRPRFPADVGGFEINSGIRVVTGLPEDHAAELRGWVRDRLDAGAKPVPSSVPFTKHSSTARQYSKKGNGETTARIPSKAKTPSKTSAWARQWSPVSCQSSLVASQLPVSCPSDNMLG